MWMYAAVTGFAPGPIPSASLSLAGFLFPEKDSAVILITNAAFLGGFIGSVFNGYVLALLGPQWTLHALTAHSVVALVIWIPVYVLIKDKRPGRRRRNVGQGSD
jgi:MFS family permease